MAEKCGDSLHSFECLEKNFMALHKKVEEDFSQVESIQMKVKALSTDWEERHRQMKVEQEKVTELEAQIKLLNTKQEEAMASLHADMMRAASQIQEKEVLAEQLRTEVAFLEKRVRAACQEAAESAAGLEKGAHEARLALEATLASLCPQPDREEAVRQSEQESPPPQYCEQFLAGQGTEWPGKAGGAEAAAEEVLQGQPQEVAGGLLEEAKPRAHRGMESSCVQKPAQLSEMGRGGSLGHLSGKGFCSSCTGLKTTSACYRCLSETHPAGADCHSALNKDVHTCRMGTFLSAAVKRLDPDGSFFLSRALSASLGILLSQIWDCHQRAPLYRRLGGQLGNCSGLWWGCQSPSFFRIDSKTPFALFGHLR